MEAILHIIKNPYNGKSLQESVIDVTFIVKVLKVTQDAVGKWLEFNKTK